MLSSLSGGTTVTGSDLSESLEYSMNRPQIRQQGKGIREAKILCHPLPVIENTNAHPIGGGWIPEFGHMVGK